MKLSHLGANYFIKVLGEREDRLPGAAGLPFESADSRELSIVLRIAASGRTGTVGEHRPNR
jgi:hypothetical protein